MSMVFDLVTRRDVKRNLPTLLKAVLAPTFFYCISFPAQRAPGGLPGGGGGGGGGGSPAI